VARIRTRSLDNTQPNNHKSALAFNRRQRSADVEDEDIEEFEEGDEDEESGVSTRKGRPTPSSNELKARGMGSTGFINRIPVVRTVVAYFRGVASEMQKVTWPTREETRRLTTVVLAVTLAFAVGLGLLDSFLGFWFRKAFHANSEGTFLLIGGLVFVGISSGYYALRNRI
jgi:preprotein translocase SecE subunit